MVDYTPEQADAIERGVRYFDNFEFNRQEVFRLFGWRQVALWPYEVSGTGDVRNLRTARDLQPDLSRHGYPSVVLSEGNIQRRFAVHRLVAEAFLGPLPEWPNVVRHKNGDRSTPWIVNLEYGTRQENEIDKREHGTAQIGENNPFSKLSDEDVKFIRESYARDLEDRRQQFYLQISHGFVKNLAEHFGVGTSMIKRVISGERWSHVQ